MNAIASLPKYDELFGPTLAVLAQLGGSGSIEEIEGALVDRLGPSQEQMDATYPKSGAHILPDRMSWARSFLKLAGYLENPSRGVWVLTEQGRGDAAKPNGEIKKVVTKAYKDSLAIKKAANVSPEAETEVEDGGEGAFGWADQLLQRVQAMEPSAFERLCQRLLRESGFVRVEVSGKSGDGGMTAPGC